MKGFWVVVVLLSALPVRAGVFADLCFCGGEHGGENDAINLLASQGVLQGHTDGLFRKETPVLRRDFAAACRRLVDFEAGLQPEAVVRGRAANSDGLLWDLLRPRFHDLPQQPAGSGVMTVAEVAAAAHRLCELLTAKVAPGTGRLMTPVEVDRALRDESAHPVFPLIAPRVLDVSKPCLRWQMAMLLGHVHDDVRRSLPKPADRQ